MALPTSRCCAACSSAGCAVATATPGALQLGFQKTPTPELVDDKAHESFSEFGFSVCRSLHEGSLVDKQGKASRSSKALFARLTEDLRGCAKSKRQKLSHAHSSQSTC